MAHLMSDYAERKAAPICTGVLDYFPLALAEVAKLSLIANEKHNPGEPLHWSKHKSNDHADCLVRHLADRGTPDADMDGLSHTVAVAWRALALLQIELEEKATVVPPLPATVVCARCGVFGHAAFACPQATGYPVDTYNPS